ncbi:putative Cop9 signalosome subunit 5 domain-containing protein [Helianthus anomalus]
MANEKTEHNVTYVGIGLMYLQMKDFQHSKWMGAAIVNCVASVLNFEGVNRTKGTDLCLFCHIDFEKLEQAEGQLSHSQFRPLIAPNQRKKEEESQLAKITRDSAKIIVEQVHGLISQVIKDILFNSVRPSRKSQPESSGPEPMVHRINLSRKQTNCFQDT